jgi:hypothetical protein
MAYSWSTRISTQGVPPRVARRRSARGDPAALAPGWSDRCPGHGKLWRRVGLSVPDCRSGRLHACPSRRRGGPRDTCTRQEHRERRWPVVTSGDCVDSGRAAKLSGHDDESFRQEKYPNFRRPQRCLTCSSRGPTARLPRSGVPSL